MSPISSDKLTSFSRYGCLMFSSPPAGNVFVFGAGTLGWTVVKDGGKDRNEEEALSRVSGKG